MGEMDLKFLINQKVDWESDDSYYFFNPESEVYKDHYKNLPQVKSRIYVMSSGSGKIIGLTKKAFLVSAESVNKHLHVTSEDRFLDTLPFFHVASLSSYARSFCGKYTHLKSEFSWDPKTFKEELESKKITMTSLVPTQVYDLVTKNLTAPSGLRVVVVGGGKLNLDLYKKARQLHWPLLPSYGLTEIASQVATASLSSLKEKNIPHLEILSHVEVKESSGFLQLRSTSLLEGHLDLSTKKWQDVQLQDSWFKTEDRGTVEGSILEIHGRGNERIKISGELVDLNALSEILKSFFNEGHLVATPCERRGFQIDLVTTCVYFEFIKEVIEKFNNKVLPYEKINNVYLVKEISIGTLSKIKQELIKKQIGF